MKQPDTQVDVGAMLDAVAASIRAAFPEFEAVAAHPQDRINLPSPACIVQLVALEPEDEADQPGTGQLAVTAILEALVVIGFREPSAEVEVARRAAALAHHVRGQRWALPVGAAVVTGIAPSDFDPELDQFAVWLVEWRQRLHIGPSIWDNDGAPPGQVLASWDPQIGPDHEGDYSDIVGGSA